MLKIDDLLKFEQDALEALKELLGLIPIAKVRKVREEPELLGRRKPDAIVDLTVGEQSFTLVCEFKTNGHPRATSMAIAQLKHYGEQIDGADAMFMAPYISEPARELCVSAGVNYLDLYGNTRIHLGGLFIERAVADKPSVEKRDLKSLFKPKSARILRWLIRDPGSPVRLQEIADGAKVSLGQVHNVKEALVMRDWASMTPDGLVLTEPDALIEAWRDVYERPSRHHARDYYTILHGDALTAKLKTLMEKDRREPILALGSYSAANWLAPYGRSETTFLYAWPEALPALEQALALEPVAKGPNFHVEVLEDESILLDAVEPIEGILITSPIQTYLDLDASGDRGKEAAEFLRRKGFGWAR